MGRQTRRRTVEASEKRANAAAAEARGPEETMSQGSEEVIDLSDGDDPLANAVQAAGAGGMEGETADEEGDNSFYGASGPVSVLC